MKASATAHYQPYAVLLYAHAQKNKYMASPPLCSERNGMATPHIAQDTYDIHGDASWLEGGIFGDADAVL